MITQELVQKLSEPFPKEHHKIKVQAFYPKGSDYRTAQRALWVSYLQHTDVAKRIEEVDPNFEFKVTNRWENNNLKYVEGYLNILGTERMNVGEGTEWKDAYSDCFKRCATMFGVGRYLYDNENIWTDWSPNYYFKKFTMSDLKSIKPIPNARVQ